MGCQGSALSVTQVLVYVCVPEDDVSPQNLGQCLSVCSHVSAKNTIGAQLIPNLLSLYSPRCLSTVLGGVNNQKLGEFKSSQPEGAQKGWVRMPAAEALRGASREGSAPSSLTLGAEPACGTLKTS